LNPKRELNARLGDARSEYVVDSDPVSGVSVNVSVYGNVEMGVLWFAVAEPVAVEAGTSVAAGSVLNLRPVDMPINDETGE
jgi:hypothetical protein